MAFTAKKLRIYRKTNAADTFGGLAATEKIEFNANGKNNTIPNLWTTHIHYGAPRGIAEHPNPTQNLSETQDTGLDESVYEVDFAISRADDVTNVFMKNLLSFNESGQENVGQLPFGRFSIEIDRNPLLNFISSSTQGLKVRNVIFDMDENESNLTTGTIILEKAIQAV